MNPITHVLASWCLSAVPSLERRDRILITIGGVFPDIDGLGIVAYALTSNSPNSSSLYHRYHHVICHNLAACLVGLGICLLLAKRRAITGLLFFVAFHLHLLCDMAGSGGADGYQWPIPYLAPFDWSCQLTWSGQWQLLSWQNMAITVALMGLSFWIAWKKGYSFFELFSNKMDRAFVQAVRHLVPLRRRPRED